MTCPLHGGAFEAQCPKCEEKSRFRKEQHYVISEAELQGQIVQALRLMGYVVLVTTVKIRSKNPRHHQTGQTKGIPDLIISKPQWVVGSWLGLEIKNEKGRVRPEQQALADLGRIVIVRSLDEAIVAARTADGELRRASAG